MNKCNEWGAPRVPVLAVHGGDNTTTRPGEFNPRSEWTKTITTKIESGTLKRIKVLVS